MIGREERHPACKALVQYSPQISFATVGGGPRALISQVDLENAP